MKAVLLDFNGTLFFDSGFHAEANSKSFLLYFFTSIIHHILLDFDLLQCNPLQLSEQERQEVSRRKEALYRRICKENPHRVQLVDGAIEFLDELKECKIPFILASASIKDNIDFYFETFALDRWFDKNQCVYDDGTYADKGEMHKEAAKRLGIELKDCVVVEDSISAITHAKENGAGCIIAIGNESAKDEILKLEVNHYIKDFTEMKFEWFK